MPRKVTIQDISRAAGTSASTVSRVLTGSATVSKEKRDAIEQVIKRLNYRPSHIARSLKTSTTYSVGLLLNEIDNPFYSAVARGIEEETNRYGYSLILCNTNEDPVRELQYLHVLQDKRVDGIILGPTGGNSDFIIEVAQQIPVVLIDRTIPDSSISAVIVDNEDGAYKATRYLLEKGYRSIALITWQQDITSMQQRFEGYQRALHEAGLAVDPANLIKVPRLTSETTAEFTLRFLKRQHSTPTAIFALNNQLGLGVLSAIHTLHLRIPDDMAVVIFDDLSMFSFYTPTISVISQPAFEIGQQAIRCLLRQINQPENYIPETVVLPTALIVRESA